MNDQRSTTDQLRDAVHILNQHGLYDAADHCRREVERVDARLAANRAREERRPGTFRVTRPEDVQRLKELRERLTAGINEA